MRRYAGGRADGRPDSLKVVALTSSPAPRDLFLQLCIFWGWPAGMPQLYAGLVYEYAFPSKHRASHTELVNSAYSFDGSHRWPVARRDICPSSLDFPWLGSYRRRILPCLHVLRCQHPRDQRHPQVGRPNGSVQPNISVNRATPASETDSTCMPHHPSFGEAGLRSIRRRKA